MGISSTLENATLAMLCGAEEEEDEARRASIVTEKLKTLGRSWMMTTSS